MNKYCLLLFLLICNYNFAQESNEIPVNTEINDVTVFIEGAQITRKKEVALKSGVSILKFTNLSPFIQNKSVQVKALGDVTVLGVNHQQNFVDKLEKSKELTDLEQALETIEEKIDVEKTQITIINEEIAFLNENRQIGGKDRTLNVNDLKTTSDFYSNKLTSLKLKELEIKKGLSHLIREQRDLEDQLKTITSKKEFANGEIIVKIEAKQATKANLTLTYVVNNAGWFPSYDIRAKDIDEPIQLVYKANVKQDTKIDWKNVKLKFSSANPNLSGIAPELRTYYLDYNMSPPRYNKSVNEISGTVISNSDNSPLPGANVMIDGTSIGTTTDFDGFYSLTVPDNSSLIKFSYIGYETKTLPVQGSTLNVRLIESQEKLEEVVVVGYGRQKKSHSVGAKLEGKVSGIQIAKAENIESKAIPMQKTENQTTIEFEVDIPYTINSDNKSYAVDMVNYKLPADYQYYAIPKIEKEAYLVANINNWEQYSLLEGEANIFFENTFVGKTILDTRFASDTLEISLGRDKNVSVNREKITDYTSKKFVGTKKEESRAWSISVKNNKSKAINMVVLDQVPVSKLDEIKVDIIESSKAKLDTDTGELKWEFDISPNEKKEFDLHYTVKYPKNRNLVVE
ncbi:DUF4139 domain-containing protein [Aestuariibaculum suncheonense]|uniref:Mucoidy inhibitor MuiA family protein n=1 Tax=Aestuariibaculum suncheonense TaxID=1028745 RepID=A0A8J6QPS5_9FLAO|nr:DUF4139 domain-containing protein [Aestuariibaculum suncheonense]MBD0834399.1 mucoidy inhibitor MuiA family protein [Aestuariibaculum suncheonense]